MNRLHMKTLRDFFKTELNLPPSVNIRTIMKTIGAESKEECYIIMEECYERVKFLENNVAIVEVKNRYYDLPDELKTLIKEFVPKHIFHQHLLSTGFHDVDNYHPYHRYALNDEKIERNHEMVYKRQDKYKKYIGKYPMEYIIKQFKDVVRQTQIKERFGWPCQPQYQEKERRDRLWYEENKYTLDWKDKVAKYKIIFSNNWTKKKKVFDGKCLM